MFQLGKKCMVHYLKEGRNQQVIVLILNWNVSSVSPFGIRSMSMLFRESKSLLKQFRGVCV